MSPPRAFKASYMAITTVSVKIRGKAIPMRMARPTKKTPAKVIHMGMARNAGATTCIALIRRPDSAPCHVLGLNNFRQSYGTAALKFLYTWLRLSHK